MKLRTFKTLMLTTLITAGFVISSVLAAEQKSGVVAVKNTADGRSMSDRAKEKVRSLLKSINIYNGMRVITLGIVGISSFQAWRYVSQGILNKIFPEKTFNTDFIIGLKENPLLKSLFNGYPEAPEGFNEAQKNSFRIGHDIVVNQELEKLFGAEKHFTRGMKFGATVGVATVVALFVMYNFNKIFSQQQEKVAIKKAATPVENKTKESELLPEPVQ